MTADFDPSDKKTPLVVYPTKAEQRDNRPDLKPIPVTVTPKFFEEYYVQQPSGEFKCVGVKPLSTLPAGRKLAWEGKLEFTATENLVLMRCFKGVIIKASVNKPLRIRTMVYSLAKI